MARSLDSRLKTLGKEIRKLRGDEPQVSLARRAKIDVKTLSWLENGIISSPRLLTLDRLSHALKTPLTSLLEHF